MSKGFSSWVKKVNAIVMDRTGRSAHNVQGLKAAYDEGISPKAMAEEIVAEHMIPQTTRQADDPYFWR